MDNNPKKPPLAHRVLALFKQPGIFAQPTRQAANIPCPYCSGRVDIRHIDGDPTKPVFGCDGCGTVFISYAGMKNASTTPPDGQDGAQSDSSFGGGFLWGLAVGFVLMGILAAYANT